MLHSSIVGEIELSNTKWVGAMHLFRGSIDLVPSRGGHLVQRSYGTSDVGVFVFTWRNDVTCFCSYSLVLGGCCGSHGIWYGAWTVVGVENRRASFVVVWFCSLCCHSKRWSFMRILQYRYGFRNTSFDPFGFNFLAIACQTRKKGNTPGFGGGVAPISYNRGSLIIFGCVASVLRQCMC